MLTRIWLKLINPALPQLVKQKYGTELRNKSITSIKVDISHALPSLIDELATMEETKVFRSTIRSNTMSGAAKAKTKKVLGLRIATEKLFLAHNGASELF